MKTMSFVNRVEATLATLPAPVRRQVEIVMRIAREMFEENKAVGASAFVFSCAGGHPDIRDDIAHDNKDKEEMWGKLRKLRAENEIVGFITEAWISRIKTDGSGPIVPARLDPEGAEGINLRSPQPTGQ